MRTAKKTPTTLIAIATSRTTVDGPCDLEEELDEDEELDDDDDDAVPDVVPVLLLVCDVEEMVDEVLEESRTSKLNHNQSIFSVTRKTTDNSHEHVNDSILATDWDGYMNCMLLIRSLRTGPRSTYL